MSDFIPMLRLDLLTLGATRKLLLTYVVLACIFAGVGGATFALPLVAMASLVVALTLFSATEGNRLIQLYGSLPLRRRTVIRAHYLTTLAVTVVAVPVGLGIGAVGSMLRDESTEGLVTGAAGTVAMLLILLAFLIPAYVKWGARAGSFVMLLTVMVLSGAVAFGRKLPIVAEFGQRVVSFGDSLLWVLLGVGLVAQVISLLVSTAIYERQDH